jgi:hypothetical protein
MAAFVETNIVIYAFVGDLNGSTTKLANVDAIFERTLKGA